MDATSVTNIKKCTGSLVGHNMHVQLQRVVRWCRSDSTLWLFFVNPSYPQMSGWTGGGRDGHQHKLSGQHSVAH